MEKIIWTNKAKISLNDIWSFYAEENLPIADKIVAEIIASAENLKFQEQYQREETLEGNYRIIIARHFKLIYRPIKDWSIIIIQIFDTRQDPSKMKI